MTIRQRIRRSRHIARIAYEYFRYLRPFTLSNRANRDSRTISSSRIVSVFSEPRGGSTWVSDIFCQLPESILIMEPLFLYPLYPEIKDVGFHFHQWIPEDAEWPEASEYFRKLYNMEIGSRKSVRLYFFNKTLKHVSRARYYVYKDCASTMLVPWLTARFDVNPVYVIRHPCAVVASQLKYKHWDYIQKDLLAHFPPPDFRYKEIFFQYQDIIDKMTKPEERMAAEWCLHNSVTIQHPLNNIRWVTVAYEKLYKEPEEEITRIFGRLGLAIPDRVLAEIRKPSGTTLNGSVADIRSGQQLESWRKVLSAEQVRNIMNIVKEFGMDFYDESTEPDYGRIFGG